MMRSPSSDRRLPASALAAALRRRGYDFFAGVPCSLLAPLYPALEEVGHPCLAAVREDEALGLAAGAHLAGRRPVVLMQNSGLGTSLNALASLHLVYDLPVLLLVTWRGEGGHDAPEHLVMGRIMLPLLEQLGVEHELLAEATLERSLDRADAASAMGRPFALVVREGALA